MDSGDRLVSALQAARRVFDHDNAALSLEQREEKWRHYWTDIGSKVNSMSASLPISLVPQKRSSCTAQLGSEPDSKRVPASLGTTAPQLERHLSAPAGASLMKRAGASPPATHTRPINIPRQQKRNNGRRLSTSCASYTKPPFGANSLDLIDEVHCYSPDDDLAQSPDSIIVTSSFSFGEHPGFERGEFATSHPSQLTVPNMLFDGTHSPRSLYTATSDSGMTSGSAAFSEPMTRANTNDQICERFGTFGVDSGAFFQRTESIPNTLGDRSSHFPSSLCFPLFPSVPMQHSQSRKSESEVSSSSSSSREADHIVAQALTAKARPLAPKRQNDVSDSQPKTVKVQAEDGTIRWKAEIPRTTRQQPQRKTTFCEYCNDQPTGFHGDHELRRHIERHHTQVRKVWICRDASEDGQFLANCKACRNRKTYGANYNAAAHLRRAHFNPCKNKRGGRGKKSEGRGGMGGGNHPPMEELKAWMFESYEINLNGKIIIHECSPDTNIADIDLEQLVGPHSQSNAVEPDFELELDQSMPPTTQKRVPIYSHYYPANSYHVPMAYNEPMSMPLTQQYMHQYHPSQQQQMAVPIQPQPPYPYYH